MMNNPVAEARYEETGTWVFWDIDECPVPRGWKSQEIAQKIISALNKLNYCGPLSISAYGNMNHIPSSIKQALSSTGIVLNHVTPTGSGLGRLYMFDKMLEWKREIPPPANLMLISRDGGLCYLLRNQKEYNNTLLAHPPHSSDYMLASAKTKWLWKSILEEPL
ncbi:uncharacterized protein LOC112083909 [Eutrema salsugineum]|uniref:uncharacterized protein LOC112083909 n=1 Tax=Eutrema salsugineum TaxID=72664 RepID=UPI000CED7B93|nr:uncharacterized protein LOC112083909 [Eutrema salsugineum]